MGYIGNAPVVGVVSGDNIVDGSVDTADIKNSAVTAAKLASGAAVSNIGYTPVNKEGDTITGNLGLGVTPSAWGSSYKALQSSGGVHYGADAAGDPTFGIVGCNAFNDGSGWKYVDSKPATLYRFGNATHTWFTAPSGTAGNNISFSTAMTLTAAGALGIGTTTITDKLHVYGGDVRVGVAGTGSYRGYVIGATDGDSNAYGQLRMELSGGQLQLVAGKAGWGGFLTIHTNGSERARIGSGGNVSIATTSTGGNAALTLASSSFSIGIKQFCSNGQASNSFEVGGSAVGSITHTTTTTAYNTSSDARLKKNIIDAEDSGSDVDALQVRSFDWKVDDSHVKYGFIAQELVNVAPEAVKAGDDGEEVTDTWGVDYSKLVPMLVKEIQSLRARVAALEAN